nr:Gldg family protein [bacterium]
MAKATKDKVTIRDFFTNKRVQYGSYSLVLILIVIAVVVLANVLFTTLDNAFILRVDLTENKLFSLSTATKNVLDKLEDELHIYTLYQAGSENKYVVNTLDSYVSATDKIIVKNVDPVRNPAFAARFKADQTGELQRDWLIVANKDESKYRIIRDDDLFTTKTTSDSTTGYVNSLTIEQRVTSAVVYVSAKDSPVAYFLQGHGEPALTDLTNLTSQLDVANYDVRALELGQGSAEGRLQKGDTLIVLAPLSDLTPQEYEAIRAFMLDGGKTLFAFTPGTSGQRVESLPYFEALLGLYNVTITPEFNLVLEDDTAYYSTSKDILRPVVGEHDVTAAIRTARLPVFAPVSMNLKVDTFGPMYTRVSPILTTSANAYAKAGGIAEKDLDRKDGDASGIYNLGVLVEYMPQDKDKCNMAVFSSGMMFQSPWNTNIANIELFMSTVGWMGEQTDTIVVQAKSLEPPALTLPSAKVAYTLAALVCIVLPLVVLATGMVVFLKRRHL